MKNKLSIAFFILFGFLILSCSEEKSVELTTSDIFSELNQSAESGLFRGVEMGMKKNQVVALEQNRNHERKIKPLQFRDKDDELLYRYSIPGMDSAYYELSYVFDKLGLFEIHFDVFMERENQVQELFTFCKDAFDKRFGTSTQESMFTTWYHEGKNNSTIEVSIVDDTRYHGSPLFSIFFHEQTAGSY
jgi:hypothetical protein